jgi:hypothetical protein
VVLMAWLAGPAPALAFRPAPQRSYKKPSPDGRYVFVMLSPHEAEGGEQDRALREAYPRSGLYRNDGSNEPLWTVSWYAYPSCVEVASDGTHLVRRGNRGWLMGSEAFSLYAHGQLVRAYTVGQLVAAPWLLSKGGEGPKYDWVGWTEFDDATMSYTVRTKDGNRWVFDVRTGEVVSASRPLRALYIVGSLAVLTLAGATLWSRRRAGRAAPAGQGLATAGAGGPGADERVVSRPPPRPDGLLVAATAAPASDCATSEGRGRFHAEAMLCFLAVALLSLLNGPLQRWSLALLEAIFAGSLHDHYDDGGPLVPLLPALAQAGLFALLWLPLSTATRGWPDRGRAATVALTFGYLGLWVLWNLWA